MTPQGAATAVCGEDDIGYGWLLCLAHQMMKTGMRDKEIVSTILGTAQRSEFEITEAVVKGSSFLH